MIDGDNANRSYDERKISERYWGRGGGGGRGAGGRSSARIEVVPAHRHQPSEATAAVLHETHMTVCAVKQMIKIWKQTPGVVRFEFMRGGSHPYPPARHASGWDDEPCCEIPQPVCGKLPRALSLALSPTPGRR